MLEPFWWWLLREPLVALLRSPPRPRNVTAILCEETHPDDPIVPPAAACGRPASWPADTRRLHYRRRRFQQSVYDRGRDFAAAAPAGRPARRARRRDRRPLGLGLLSSRAGSPPY